MSKLWCVVWYVTSCLHLLSLNWSQSIRVARTSKSYRTTTYTSHVCPTLRMSQTVPFALDVLHFLFIYFEGLRYVQSMYSRWHTSNFTEPNGQAKKLVCVYLHNFSSLHLLYLLNSKYSTRTYVSTSKYFLMINVNLHSIFCM